jgi:hypothetical protein
LLLGIPQAVNHIFLWEVNKAREGEREERTEGARDEEGREGGRKRIY